MNDSLNVLTMEAKSFGQHSFPKTMTATEKLHQLIQALPEDQINEVLHFAEFLHQKRPRTPQSKEIPPGTLTGLRGIAKHPGSAPSDTELQADYTNYLSHKYQ